MNILGIVGSPRKNGNTEIMLKEALRVAAEAGCETELFFMCGQETGTLSGLRHLFQSRPVCTEG